MRVATMLLFIVLGSAALGLAVAGSRGEETLPMEKHRKIIVSIQDPLDAASTYKALFEDPKKLKSLKNDPNVSIALQAAWEICNRTVKSTTTPQRFLGFVEGRTDLAIPLRWEFNLVYRALRNERELLRDVLNRYLPSCDFLEPSDREGGVMYKPMRLQESVLDLWVPEGTRTRQTEGLVEFATDQGKVTLSQKVLSDLKGKDIRTIGDLSLLRKRCTVHIGGEHSYVAVFEARHGRYPVVCIDSRTGKVVWQSDVWAPGPPASSGPGMHEVSVVLGTSSVALFGQASGDCYIEAFDLETGKSVFRFSTYYSR